MLEVLADLASIQALQDDQRRQDTGSYPKS